MSTKPMSKTLKRLAAAFVVALLVGGGGIFWLFGNCDICLAAVTIPLSGTVAQNCTIDVTTTANASNLDLIDGVQHVQVGNVNQSCNKKAGYTLSLTSANCATPTPAGAKVYDSVSGEFLAYSGEFINPTTGGSSSDVTGLLATVCSGQTARDVTNAKVNNEDSTVWVNYTGNATLAAGTYTDTLTVTLTTK